MNDSRLGTTIPVFVSSCSKTIKDGCYRILVMGSTQVGKTSIIDQFLGRELSTKYKATIQEMYNREFIMGSNKYTLEIEDTSGFFAYDFPAMLEVSLTSADAVLLVYSVADAESFNMIGNLRDIVMQCKGPDTPMVIVGNKTDEERIVDKKETEALVMCDWENGYIECSAKASENINLVFQELINQVHNDSEFCKSLELANIGELSRNKWGRRKSQSLQIIPHLNTKQMDMKTSLMGRRRSKSVQYDNDNGPLLTVPGRSQSTRNPYI